MEENYLPLFRKYRPQSFSDIVGQESLVKALSNAIELNRIASAYLFCGPRGTGKTSSARILAKSLNCEHGPTLTPCQKCASCVDITNATGLDVIEIDAASNRGIQDAKELISKAQYAPINGKYKIFIIDEVHMLSTDAFNALLKTFEEPPKNVIFILATTEPHKVLETIVSRCQRFDLRRITTEDIVKRLREISDLEKIKITDEALFAIAKNVSGGLRDSLALLDQVSILGVKEEITKDLIDELLGKINFDVLFNLLIKIHSDDIEQSLIGVDEIYAKGNEPRNLCENFIEFLRNVVLVLNSKNTDLILNFTTLISQNIEKIKESALDKDKIIKILNTMIEYYKEIKISTNPYLWMELAVIAACRLDLAPSIQNAPVEISSFQNKKQIALSAQAPIFKPSQASQAPQTLKSEKIEKPAQIMPQETISKTNAANEIEIEKENMPGEKTLQPSNQNPDAASLWANVTGAISSLPARAFYSGVAKLVKIENNKITLGFLHENTLIQAKSPSKLPQLQNALNSVCAGYEVEFIKIDPDTKTIDFKPKITPSAPLAQKQENFETSAQKTPQTRPDEAEAPPAEPSKQIQKKHYSPRVQEMIEQFSGKIIED